MLPALAIDSSFSAASDSSSPRRTAMACAVSGNLLSPMASSASSGVKYLWRSFISTPLPVAGKPPGNPSRNSRNLT